ncbi:MAG: helix-hairpin-helix domain-containing protein [Cryomorphaceae bacterium]|nr:helix-hairpin-helix domain-containing protein [Cryomorphaceae bacterium]
MIYGAQVHAQIPLEREIESVAENIESEEGDLVQIAENLEIRREQKININTADRMTLAEFPFLNAFQINNILQYIKKNGPLLAPYELMAIKAMDLETAKQLSEFIYFGSGSPKKIPWKKMFKYGRHNTLTRWQRVLNEQEGYKRRRVYESTGESQGTHYLGDPNRFFARHRFTFSRHIQMGLTLEKDPGEPWQNPIGFDFLSGHIAIMDVGHLKRLVVGDFQAQFGQGLALWSSMAFSKSAMTLNSQRFSRGVYGYTGADENRFFRGTAATIQWGKTTVSGFYSNKGFDASIPSNDPEVRNGLQWSGLHRTPTELANKNSLTIQTIGGNIQRDFGDFHLGITAVDHQLASPIVPPDQLYRQNQFRGSHSQNLSMDYQWVLRGMQFFGEVAKNERGAWAQTHGVYVEVDQQLIFNLHHRNFSPQYDALFMAPFGESHGKGNGERGTYLGFEWRPFSKWVTHAYADHYQFQWLRFQAGAPTKGVDYLWQTEYIHDKNTSVYFRLRWQNRDINGENEQIIRPLANESRGSARLHFSHQLDRWVFASRLEMSRRNYLEESQNGWLIFQDLRYHFLRVPLVLTMRYALFDTDGYAARIYAYEHDVLYAFSIPAYFSTGRRMYLLLKWKTGKKIDLWLRYANTHHHGTHTMGSGLNTIEGNNFHEIKVQCRLKF